MYPGVRKPTKPSNATVVLGLAITLGSILIWAAVGHFQEGWGPKIRTGIWGGAIFPPVILLASIATTRLAGYKTWGVCLVVASIATVAYVVVFAHLCFKNNVGFVRVWEDEEGQERDKSYDVTDLTYSELRCIGDTIRRSDNCSQLEGGFCTKACHAKNPKQLDRPVGDEEDANVSSSF